MRKLRCCDELADERPPLVPPVGSDYLMKGVFKMDHKPDTRRACYLETRIGKDVKSVKVFGQNKAQSGC